MKHIKNICGHFGKKCKLVKTSEVTPNSFNIVLDDEDSDICHVLQASDDEDGNLRFYEVIFFVGIVILLVLAIGGAVMI